MKGKRIKNTGNKLLSVFVNPTLAAHVGYENGLDIGYLTRKVLAKKNPNRLDMINVSVALHNSVMNPNSKYYLPIISKQGVSGWRYFLANTPKELLEYKENRCFILDSMRKTTFIRTHDGQKMLSSGFEAKAISYEKNKKDN